MAFIVNTMTTPCKDKESIISIMIHLASNGYNPLITHAKQQFLSTFGKKVSRETLLQELQPGSPIHTFTFENVWRSSFAIYNAGQGLLSGDLFYSPQGNGFLYVRLASSPLQIEIGYLGDRIEVES